MVTARGSSSTVYSNLTNTNTLASVFEELLNSSLLRKAILSEIDAPVFDGTIEASIIPGTNLLNVTVTAGDPRTTALLEACKAQFDYITLDTAMVTVMDMASTATAKTTPKRSKPNKDDRLRETGGGFLPIYWKSKCKRFSY